MIQIITPGVEYDTESKDLMLIRCPKCGKENYALNVLTGICTWCGYNAKEMLTGEFRESNTTQKDTTKAL